VSPTVYAANTAFEKAGVAPEDVDVLQLRDTDAGAEVIHMAEAGFCTDGEQEKLLADGATENHRCDAGEHRRRVDRQRRTDQGVRAAPGTRDSAPNCGARPVTGGSPELRASGSRRLTAPGTAAATILTTLPRRTL
jgi:acetyl-CoA C-acetyltransferase